MPLRTSELLAYAAVTPRTLAKWKARYRVKNARRGWWTVQELAALEGAAANKLRKK